MLKVIEFIKAHKDWESILSQSPYFIKMTCDNKLGHNMIIFKYNQLNSDFSNEIVRECRGLIIDEDSLEPISVPFFKFGNYGESYCPNIDWSSAVITEKIDGSLIKIVRLGNDLLISTNGTIDASKAEIVQGFDCKYLTYRDLVLGAKPFVNMEYKDIVELFKENFTYMFELTSPYNKVIVPHNEIVMNFIGIRNNKTLQEELLYKHPLSKVFNCPKQYDLHSLDECIKAAQLLDYRDEGYVVVDKYFNRVKIKSPAYVAIHHMKGEGILTPKKALELIKLNEQVEFLTYFNEYRANFEDLTVKFDKLIEIIQEDYDGIKDELLSLPNKKEQALYIKDCCEYESFAFAMLTGKVQSAKEWIGQLDSSKIIEYMEKEGLKSW